jgi:hypothetical protein
MTNILQLRDFRMMSAVESVRYFPTAAVYDCR